MPTEIKTERTSVNVDSDVYKAFSKIASLIGVSIREAGNEALQDWCKRNAVMARKKANQLLAGGES